MPSLRPFELALPINPATKKPLNPKDLEPIFPNPRKMLQKALAELEGPGD